MSKQFEARRTHGSFAELTGEKPKAITGKCERCGAPLKAASSPKRFCGPCSSERHDELVLARRRAKVKAKPVRNWRKPLET